MLLSTILALSITNSLAQDCYLNFSHPNSPFVVDENLNFPSRGDNEPIRFDYDTLFYIKCPPDSSSPLISKEGDLAICRGGTTILNTVTVELLDFNSIKCLRSTGNVRRLNQSCEGNGTLIETGFEIYGKWVPTVTICFDERRLTPFYVKFNTSLTNITYSADYRNFYDSYVCKTEIGCNFVDNGNLYSEVDMDGIYKSQTEILRELGVAEAEEKSKLLRLQLAFEPLLSGANNISVQPVQYYAAYDYVNIVPVWEKYYGDLMWLYALLVDIDGSSYAYVGTLGVATLYNTTDEPVELYLNDGQVPVPKWLWILPEESQPDGLIGLLFNNPYADPNIAEVCDDPSQWYGRYGGCPIDSVVDPVLKEFIDNYLNQKSD